MKGRVCIIANKGSGRRNAERIRQAMLALAEGLEEPPTLRLVRSGRRLARAARSAVAEGFGTIVAAGGDGTVAAVADELVGTGVALAALPLGTFNFFARRLGLPEDPVQAAGVLARGRAEPMDVAEVNGRVFLNNASLGMYPAILAERESFYHRFGRSRLVAYWSVLRTIFTYSDTQWLVVHSDGDRQVIRTPSVFVAASAYQLRYYGLEGADLLAEGKLAIFMAPDVGRWKMIRIALRLALGWARSYQDFTLLGGSDVVIEAPHRSRRTVARDGEYGKMTAPFRFQMKKAALWVVEPDGADRA